MPHRAFYAYPWDLPGGRDGEARAHQVQGWLEAHGLNSLTLAASYHAGKFLTPRGVVFPEDGTVYFHPTLERYGRLKPQVASVAAERSPFQELAGRAGFSLTAWTVLLHNTRLGTLHPDLTVRNAFGNPYPYSLCPAQPEVRAYATALCLDLADHHPLTGLALESPGWLTQAHGFHHEFQQVEPNPWLESLLGLCFCDACLAGAKTAGIDGAGLRTRLAQTLTAFLAGPAIPGADMAQGWFAADLLQDPDLAAYLRWRCEGVTNLVAEIRASIRRDVQVHVIATCQRPHATAFLEGHDLPALHRACDGLELPLYQPCPSAVASDLWDVRRRLDHGVPPRVILRPGPPDMGSEGQLRDTLAQLQAQGVEDISFYNAGLLRPTHLAWLSHALLS